MSITWLEMVVTAMAESGGDAVYSDLYGKIEKLYPEKISSVKDYKAQVRGTIESFSSHSEVYKKNKSKNKRDLFYKKEKGHWGLRCSEEINLTEDDESYHEGKQKLRLHLIRERNSNVTKKAKENYYKKYKKYECVLCKFDFQKKYKELYIEGHHIIPVSELNEGDKTDVKDILLVCANCHRMLHRKNNWKTVEELRDIIKEKQ